MEQLIKIESATSSSWRNRLVLCKFYILFLRAVVVVLIKCVPDANLALPP